MRVDLTSELGGEKSNGEGTSDADGETMRKQLMKMRDEKTTDEDEG